MWGGTRSFPIPLSFPSWRASVHSWHEVPSLLEAPLVTVILVYRWVLA